MKIFVSIFAAVVIGLVIYSATSNHYYPAAATLFSAILFLKLDNISSVKSKEE